jgi:hypothetical protein
VACITIGWRRSGISVAKVAGHGRMRPGQREGRIIVIEICTRPIERGVTDRAVLREPHGNMIRNAAPECCSTLPGRYVAPVAGGGFKQVVVAHMASNAGSRSRGNVHSGQGKPCCAVVVRCCIPTQRCVASGTVPCRKCRSRSGVRRGVGILPVC